MVPLEAGLTISSARRQTTGEHTCDQQTLAHSATGPCPAENAGSLRLPSLGSESPERLRSSCIISQEMECKVRKPESAVTYSPEYLDLFGL